MKLLTYQPLKGCRVPVDTGMTVDVGGRLSPIFHVPFQHGAHIDSMPIEKQLKPIEGPANVLKFNSKA